MVSRQIAARGITDPRLLEAFRSVPREEFVDAEMAEFAYNDSPLPIGHEQTISQPYIVAYTIDALALRATDRVLEIGAGSGYAAAVLSRLVKEVYTVERLAPLAELARARFARLGYDNVHVLCADGTLGWPEHAPYDAIAVAAGGPEIPKALIAQLRDGGRLVIPVGRTESSQVLTRAIRESATRFREEPLTEVRFVPLIGEQGWSEERPILRAPGKPSGRTSVSTLVRETAEVIDDLQRADLRALVERVGDAKVVLLGESTHGTSEFYRMRARITRELIEHAGFDFVAVEADWPDAARIDTYVVGDPPRSPVEFTPFARFPTWMWRNQEVHEFVNWLRHRNLKQSERTARVGFHGLDLYSLFTSIAVVLAYLDKVDPDAARVARHRYGMLTPWQQDPAAYGRAVLVGRYESSEGVVLAMLKDMLERRFEYARKDGERFFDAAQNARVVAAAEHYYRAMYYGSAASWNLRDTHMFQTLQALFAFYGPNARGIVWEHNSHIGDARATEMSARGELNIGQLCRQTFGQQAYLIGFGTDHGTVAAAHNWGDPMQEMRVRPGHPESYERVFHESGLPAFMLHLKNPRRRAIREELAQERLERAIGVIYRPDTELQSHYFRANLARQFDEFIWFDETRAVTHLPVRPSLSADFPDTYPFGL